MNDIAKRRFLIAACTLAFAAAAPQALSFDWTWTKGEQVKGNGKVQRQARETGPFTGISLSLPGNVEVRSGARDGVTVETDANLLPLIETVVENGTLQIRARKHANLQTRTLKFVVQARQLERLSLGGSGDIDADTMRGERIRIDIGGSGDVKVGKVEGGTLDVDIGGSGDLDVGGGNVRSLSVSLAGAGDVDLARVRSEDAKVSIAGSGDAKVWARNALSTAIAGSGDVDYYGDPRVSKSVVGSGEVRRQGAAPR